MVDKTSAGKGDEAVAGLLRQMRAQAKQTLAVAGQIGSKLQLEGLDVAAGLADSNNACDQGCNGACGGLSDVTDISKVTEDVVAVAARTAGVFQAQKTIELQRLVDAEGGLAADNNACNQGCNGACGGLFESIATAVSR